MIYFGYQQGHTLGWVSKPGVRAVVRLVASFAGAQHLVPLSALIAAGGVAAGWRARRPGQLTLTGVALPWLLLPPVILIAVSQVHPVYVQRYVVVSLPALAVLMAAGLAGLARLAAATRIGRHAALAWLPSAVVVAALAMLLAGPQQVIRRSAARPDNLRAAAAIVAAHARPGDVVFYVPGRTQVVSLAYPAPFRRLRNVAQAQTPTASDSLVGTAVRPSVLRRRYAGARRTWIIQWHRKHLKRPRTKIGQEELALVRGMRLVGRWHARSIVLSLYAVNVPGQPLKAARPRFGA
jgi:mannosyltransferase